MIVLDWLVFAILAAMVVFGLGTFLFLIAYVIAFVYKLTGYKLLFVFGLIFSIGTICILYSMYVHFSQRGFVVQRSLWAVAFVGFLASVGVFHLCLFFSESGRWRGIIRNLGGRPSWTHTSSRAIRYALDRYNEAKKRDAMVHTIMFLSFLSLLIYILNKMFSLTNVEIIIFIVSYVPLMIVTIWGHLGED